MATIKPFLATRYASDRFAKPPVAPPYDIISEQQRQAIAQDANNIIHIDKPGKAGDDAQYARAVDILNNWKKQGVLLQEKEPSFYVYEQHYQIPEADHAPTRRRVGLFVRLRLARYEERVVLPHEKTLSGPKVDRMNLLKATATNISPIFGLYHDTSRIIAATLEKAQQSKPLYETYVDQDGTTHRLWRLDDPSIVRTIENVMADKQIMIADGHHRYETSLQYRDWLCEQKGQLDAEDPSHYVLACLTDFSDEGLVVLPTHRLLQAKLKPEDLLEKLRQYFDVQPTTPEAIKTMVQDLEPKGAFQIGIAGGSKMSPYLLLPKGGVDYGAFMPAERSRLWKELNVNILSFVVFSKILGLTDERFQQEVTYTHSFEEGWLAAEQGLADYTFFLQGLDKFKVKAISENGELMPQKSTYFYPKLFTGFVLYEHRV